MEHFCSNIHVIITVDVDIVQCAPDRLWYSHICAEKGTLNSNELTNMCTRVRVSKVLTVVPVQPQTCTAAPFNATPSSRSVAELMLMTHAPETGARKLASVSGASVIQSGAEFFWRQILESDRTCSMSRQNLATTWSKYWFVIGQCSMLLLFSFVGV